MNQTVILCCLKPSDFSSTLPVPTTSLILSSVKITVTHLASSYSGLTFFSHPRHSDLRVFAFAALCLRLLLQIILCLVQSLHMGLYSNVISSDSSFYFFISHSAQNCILLKSPSLLCFIFLCNSYYSLTVYQNFLPISCVHIRIQHPEGRQGKDFVC